ncbi:MAG: hypothetical protein QMD46_09755 [Methanomicrobiales archaeon]|nr:hypothetical protein [Methanomicrobiales archaeon]MDI6877375.1 hypothetical protein [Methanomicrobiales archaeon]
MAITKSLKDYLMREELMKLDAEWARIKQAREELVKQQLEIEQKQMDLERKQAEIDRQWAAINAEREKMRIKEKPPDRNEIKPKRTEPQKVSSTKEVLVRYPKAYEKWTFEEDDRLAQAYLQGATIESLADDFQRQPGAIRARLQKLDLIGKNR